MAVTTDRKTIRREIGRDYGDIIVLTATTAGSTLSLVDNVNLTLPDSAFRGRDMRFTSGTNSGLNRKVTGSSQSGKSVSWSVETTIATATNDEAEIWNTRGVNISPGEVDDAINSAIRFASARFWVPTYATVTAVFDADATVATLPAAITRGVSAVHYDDPSNTSLWTRIPKAMSYGDPGWHLDRPLGVIRIGGIWAGAADNRNLRVYGYGSATVMTADTDTTPINLNWIIAKAKAICLEHHMEEQRDNPSYGRRWENAIRESERWEAAAFGRRDPDTEMV